MSSSSWTPAPKRHRAFFFSNLQPSSEDMLVVIVSRANLLKIDESDCDDVIEALATAF